MRFVLTALRSRDPYSDLVDYQVLTSLPINIRTVSLVAYSNMEMLVSIRNSNAVYKKIIGNANDFTNYKMITALCYQCCF